MSAGTLPALLEGAIGAARAENLTALVKLDPEIEPRADEDGAPRRTVSMALGVMLLADLLERVPTARAYVEDVRAAGGTVMLDHGALRTIRFADGPTGALPGGREAFARLLEPLGYAQAGIYPLDRLGMTGFSYAQADRPETLPQYFVSELHVERFSPEFQAAAERVFGTAEDRLSDAARALLDEMAARGAADPAVAVAGLPGLADAFGRWHATPAEADYEILLTESPEAAWIATEGSTFNHATDRVSDVEALAEREREKGRPIKDAIEVSGSGRVRQTAYKADPVEREFVAPGGGRISRTVPGSFYEFITRDRMDDGALDLAFDSANAQGIFKMTSSDKGA